MRMDGEKALSDEKNVRIVRKHKDQVIVFPNNDWSEEEVISMCKTILQ